VIHLTSAMKVFIYHLSCPLRQPEFLIRAGRYRDPFAISTMRFALDFDFFKLISQHTRSALPLHDAMSDIPL